MYSMLRPSCRPGMKPSKRNSNSLREAERARKEREASRPAVSTAATATARGAGASRNSRASRQVGEGGGQQPGSNTHLRRCRPTERQRRARPRAGPRAAPRSRPPSTQRCSANGQQASPGVSITMSHKRRTTPWREANWQCERRPKQRTHAASHKRHDEQPGTSTANNKPACPNRQDDAPVHVLHDGARAARAVLLPRRVDQHNVKLRTGVTAQQPGTSMSERSHGSSVCRHRNDARCARSNRAEQQQRDQASSPSRRHASLEAEQSAGRALVPSELRSKFLRSQLRYIGGVARSDPQTNERDRVVEPEVSKRCGGLEMRALDAGRSDGGRTVIETRQRHRYIHNQPRSMPQTD